MATLQEIAEKFGDIDSDGQPLDSTKVKWIEENLTGEDIEAWHSGNCTDHVRQLIDEMGVDCIQIWGSNTGTEPLSVVMC